jgi:hypothetical protein
LPAQSEEHVLDVLVADFDLGLVDLDLVEILELDLGQDLEGRDVGEVLVVLTLG